MTAARIDLGPFNAAVALTIATIKATLVALFFMHVKGSSEKLTKLVVISAFSFLLILLGLSMSDYATRSWSCGFSQLAHLTPLPLICGILAPSTFVMRCISAR